MTRFLVLIAFVLVLQGVGYLLGTSFPADEWYASLEKPFFNPPSWLFGVVWPILYLLVAVAGWRVFTSDPQIPGWGYWLGQLAFNWAWTPVFFGLHLVFWGIWVIVGGLLLSIGFMVRTWPHDKLASLCFAPYVAWLSFALLLNVSIWWLNA